MPRVLSVSAQANPASPAPTMPTESEEGSGLASATRSGKPVIVPRASVAPVAPAPSRNWRREIAWRRLSLSQFLERSDGIVSRAALTLGQQGGCH